LHYDDIYTYGCDLYTGATYSRDFTVFVDPGIKVDGACDYDLL